MSQPAGYRIWVLPDGSVTIYTHLRSEPEAQARNNAKLAALLPAGSTFVDVATTEAIKALLPANRTERHKWRLRGGRVVVDQSVPAPVDPRQALRARATAAGSLTDLKGVVADLIGGA